MISSGACVFALTMKANRLLPAPVHEVTNGQDRVPAKHAGPGIPHNGLDLVPHIRLEAMHRAPGAGSLPFLERALLETVIGIGQKLDALSA